MKHIFKKLILITFTVAIFSGCESGSNLPMYYWGDYPDVIYDYSREVSGNLDKDIKQLEKIISKSAKEKRKVPPGLRAHLALLYIHAGDNVRGAELFEQEKQAFPYGSHHFVDFQLKRLNANLSPTEQNIRKTK